MEANQYISLALLVGRFTCVYILSLVIRKQWRALRSKNYPELRPLREKNLLGTIILVIMNFFPIVLDTFGIFGRGSFSLLLAYVFSNNLSAILYSYMLWTSLRLAERIVISDE